MLGGKLLPGVAAFPVGNEISITRPARLSPPSSPYTRRSNSARVGVGGLDFTMRVPAITPTGRGYGRGVSWRPPKPDQSLFGAAVQSLAEGLARRGLPLGQQDVIGTHRGLPFPRKGFGSVSPPGEFETSLRHWPLTEG